MKCHLLTLLPLLILLVLPVAEADQPVRLAQADPAAATSAGADEEMVHFEGFSIDKYEYPNQRGVKPKVDVTWEEANRLCQVQGKRLCSEIEWDRACRGEADFLYSYANAFEPGRCNTPYQKDGIWHRAALAPSGSFAACANAEGVHDMIGNIWEWTADWFDSRGKWHVVRGGSWFNNVNFARADGRYGNYLEKGYHLDLIGFRCCR